VPGTGVYLVYVSSQSAGYLSTVVMRVTSRQPPVNLVVVHVRVTVEGVQSQHVLAAQPSLTHTFSWNKHNAYNQKVYGLATAISTSHLSTMTLVNDSLSPVSVNKYNDNNVTLSNVSLDRRNFLCST